MTDLHSLSPYIRVASDNIITSPWKVAERVIFDYELLFIKEGHVRITVEDRVYEGLPGDVFLFKPKQRHSIEMLDLRRFRQPHLHFDLVYREDSPSVKVSFRPLERMSAEELPLFREDLTAVPPMLLPNKLSVPNLEYFESLLFAIIQEKSLQPPLYELHLKELFLKLWTYLLRENIRSASSKGEAPFPADDLMEMKEYLRVNTDKPVSLESLAVRFNLSKFHLLRLFKSAFGMTPIHYHLLLRVEKAKEMVQYSRRSLTEVAQLCGFTSLHSFSRAFRKIEGVPPSYYRQR